MNNPHRMKHVGGIIVGMTFLGIVALYYQPERVLLVISITILAIIIFLKLDGKLR